VAGGGGHINEHVQALVYTSVNDVIFHLRVEGDRFRFIHINRAFTEATGLAEDQVVGLCIDEVIPEPSRTLVLEKYRQAIAERRTVRWEEVTDYPTGKRIGEVSVTPVVEASGQIHQLIGTVSDVTKLREKQQLIHLYAEVMREVQIALTAWRVGDPDDLNTYRLAASNPAASRLGKVDLEAAVGKSPLEIVPSLTGSRLLQLASAVARSGEKQELAEVRSRIDPNMIISAKAFPLSDHCIGLAIEDVTAAHNATRLLVGERRVLELLAAGLDIKDILTALVELIEELLPKTIATVVLVDESGTELRVAAAPGLPAAYNDAVDGVRIGPRTGSCGTAAYYGQPVLAEDILTDPLWADYRDLAKLSGMRACWSTPIFSADQRVLGTFALYRDEPGLPDRGVLEIIERATHIASLVIERRQLDEQLRALAARIEAVREEERTGIARELHDELGQALTALKLDVAWLARNMHENGHIHERLDEMAQLADTTLQSVRRISSELRPVILDELGLGATIQWQADEFGARTNIELRVDNALAGQPIDRTVSTAAFRIFQEALTNIARHADATHVDVRLRATEGNLIMEVADDGVGLPETFRGSQQSLGLVSMRERARRLGGDCIVMRREPRGTLVVLSVPLEVGPEAAAHPVH